MKFSCIIPEGISGMRFLSMNELVGLYALWLRELLVFWREKSRIVSSLFTPILWLVVFGNGVGSAVDVDGVGYQKFIFPGIICMSVLFSSVFFGLYIIMDKRIDFFKAVIVAPLARITIFSGKMLGGCTDAMIQVAILLMFGAIFGINYSMFNVSLTFVFLILLSMSLVSLGLILGVLMDSHEGFNMIVSFLVFPMFFLSGALFPLSNLPKWLKVITYFDPMTYAVDGVRGALIGIHAFPIYTDLLAMTAVTAVMVWLGTLSFRRLR